MQQNEMQYMYQDRHKGLLGSLSSLNGARITLTIRSIISIPIKFQRSLFPHSNSCRTCCCGPFLALPNFHNLFLLHSPMGHLYRAPSNTGPPPIDVLCYPHPPERRLPAIHYLLRCWGLTGLAVIPEPFSATGADENMHRKPANATPLEV